MSKNIFVVVVISEGKFKQFGLSNYSAWEVVSVYLFLVLHKFAKRRDH